MAAAREAAAPPPLPAEADVESIARAAAGGGAAARRRPALSGPRGARVGATAAARLGEAEAEAVEAEAEAVEEEAEAEEGGVHEAGPRLQEEAMNGDGTESDWQGLVSEVRPRRRPGGQGRLRAVAPAHSPRPPGWPSGAGTRGGRAGPRPRQVRRSSRASRASRAPLCSAPSGASFWGGAFPLSPRRTAARFGPGLESAARASGRRGAKPHLLAWSPLFWSLAIGRPVPKRKGGAGGCGGEIWALGFHSGQVELPAVEVRVGEFGVLRSLHAVT